jgi:uncharacterized membrane protein
MRRIFVLSLLVSAMLAAGLQPAAAYIGPGAGVSAIGTVIALIGAVLLAIVGFIWYPAKRILRRFKGAASAGQEKTSAS